MNHAVLYVRDVERSVAFYRDLLDFRVKFEVPGQAAFLQAPASNNDHDIGLFQIGAGAGPSEAGRTTVGLYHLAWEVDTLDELDRLAGKLGAAGALVGASDHGTTKALYAHDPDGLEFEVCWLVPADRLPVDVDAITKPLDLSAEKARYGGSTRGGVGVSVLKPTVSPLAGTVVEVLVQPNDDVREGRVVVVVESMKMEHEVAAASTGTVRQVAVGPGDTVAAGDQLLLIEDGVVSDVGRRGA